ncbi:MAG: SPOR domain-containing protein [Gammaproteobacteria bacterium]|nr:SPOR domain-containing protein [Gammaproteobacteria bacterium]
MGDPMQEQPPANGDKFSRKWLLISVLAVVAVGIFLFLSEGGNAPKRQSTPLALPQQPAIEVTHPAQSQAQLSSPSSVVRPATPSSVAGGEALLHETGAMPAPQAGPQSAAITPPAGGGVSQPSSTPALQGAVERPASGTAAQTSAAPAGTKTQPAATRKPPRRIAAVSRAAIPHGPQPRREDWLLKQNPHSYAVQLMGASHEQGILSFIKTHKLGGRAAYFRTRYRGRAWYVLLYGIYPNRPAAQAALKRLPPALRKTSPWVRNLASVRTAIEQARK